MEESRVTMSDVRRRLFRLIDATPNLDWLLLTKRPQNIAPMMPASFLDNTGAMERVLFGPKENIWLGTSVEDQETADARIPHLLNVTAKVRFLSVEPLLGPVDLRGWGWIDDDEKSGSTGIHWVIVGGESGPNARPCNIEWIRNIVRQCKEAGVPCFVKQLGSRSMRQSINSGNPVEPIYPHTFNDLKGGDMAEWPSDLRVREVPE